MKKLCANTENYLERVPSHSATISWTLSEVGVVTLEIVNTGWADCVAQLLFGRPKVSYIHLDSLGSLIWTLIDGNKNIATLGKLVEAEFGKKAQPLYTRLTRYFQILDSYHLVEWR